MRKPPEGMYLLKPRNLMEIQPYRSAFRTQVTSQLNDVGDGTEKKRPEQIAPPPSVCWPGPAPPPIPGKGAEIEEPVGQASRRGVVVPGGRKRRKKLFPLGPPTAPHPGSHLRPQGPSKQDGGVARGGRGHSAGTSPGSARTNGEGDLLREGPLKPEGKPRARRQAKL